MDENQLQILVKAIFDEAESLRTMQRQLQAMEEKLDIAVTAKLNKRKSRQRLKKDLASITDNVLKVTGKLDKTKSRKNLKTDLSSLGTETIKFNAEVDTTELNKILAEISNRTATIDIDTNTGNADKLDDVGDALDSITKKSQNTAINIAVLYQTIQKLINIAEKMISISAELDKGLTDVRMTLGTSYEDTSRLIDSYNALAKELKSTTSQAIDASVTWLRQGKTLAETNELIRQSMILSKVGNMESATATERLTSALNGYKLAASDAAAVVDKLTAVDMEAAVSADSIAEALSHTASSAHIAGVELDKIIAYLTVVQETTQRDASVIGESFKTIFARMSKITNGDAVDDYGENISNVESTLRELGIELRKSETEFRNFDDVLDDVGNKWSTLNDTHQSEIATAFGGVYQRNNFITLMDNYDKVAKYVDTAANSAGTAAEKFTAYTESIEAHYNSMIASAEALSKQTVPPELLNGLMDAAAAMMDFTAQAHLLEIALASVGSAAAVKGFATIGTHIKSAYDNVKSLTTAFSLLSQTSAGQITADQFTQMLLVTKNLNAAQLKLIVSNQALTNEQRIAILTSSGLTTKQAAQTLSTMGLASAEGAATTATFSLTGALQTLKAAIASNPIGFLVVGLTTAVSVISAVTREIEQANTEARQAILETADALYDSTQEFEDAYVQTIKYAKIIDKTVEDENNLENAIDSLNSILGENAIAFDSAKMSAEDYVASLEKAATQKLYDNYIEAKQKTEAARGELQADSYSAWTGSKITISLNPYNMDDAYASARKIAEEVFSGKLDKKYYSFGNTQSFELLLQPDNWNSDHNDMDSVVEHYYKLLDVQYKLAEQDLMQTDIYQSVNAKISTLREGVEQYVKAKYNELKLNYEWQNGIPTTVDEYYKFTNAIVAAARVSGEFGDQLRALAYDDFGDSIHQVTESVTQATSETVDVSQQTISKFRGTVEALKQAVAEYSDTGEVTAATYQKVTALGEDYADLFDFTNGKIELQADELDTLAQKLVQEAGATLAANDATTDQIALISKLVSGLRKTEEETEDTLASIKDLVGVLEDAKEGTELSTLAMLDLIMQYPDLADNIIKTTNGYKLEEAAVWELIEAKKEELRINELLVKTKAREALLAGAGTEKTAANVDAIIAKYGEEISSFDDYVKFWETENNKTASGNWIDGYKEYVEASIRDLKYANALDKIIDDLNAENYLAGITPSKSSSEKEETEFEKAYKKHQHLLNMDQESVEDYLAWLNTAYQNAYATGQIELDDYYKYQEEVYDKLKTVFNDSLGDTEHQIDLLSRQDGTEDEIISLYKSLQDKVHQQAEHYRSLGLDDNHELIQELQNQWWSYYDKINDIRQKKFDEYLDVSKYEIDVLSADSGNIGQIVDSWKNILSAIHAEIEYYTSLGYKETDEVIRNLVEEAISAKESLLDAIDEVVSECDSAVEGFQNVYTTLTDAAKEYASTGTLSVDSLREILALSPKYLDFLLDENGELVVNKQAIQNVIAARTEELAVENALAYVKKILLAVEQNDIKMLAELTDAAASASSSTWDLVYATLGYAKAIGATKGMDASYFENAADYISKMQSLTKTATNSIEAYYETLEDGYVSQKDGLEQILQLTQDMIKWENEQQIKALEDEKDAYSDIIDNKKEVLRITKEQADRERSVGDKLEAIAKLQAKISQLSLDDSREAQAQKRTLEEELAELQKELADEQSDYSFEVQEEALDKELEAFEETKDDEIEALENMLGSAEQLYQAAIARIEEDWDGLYSDLLSWNENYGSVLQSELVSAWDAASEAVQRYGSFVDALEGVDNDTNLGEHTGAISGSYGSSNAGDYGSATSILSAMKRNSLAWFTASDSERKSIEAAQKDLANEWKNTFGETLTSKNGSWYREDGSLLYRLSNDEVGSAIVDKMKENADAWHTTSDTQAQQALAKENEKLAKLLSGYIGQQITKSRDGTWWLGSSKLFDVYHDGGIVGEKSKLKSNEVIAKLEEGELIVPAKPTKNLLDYVYENPQELPILRRIKAGLGYSNAINSVSNHYNTDNSDSSVKEITVNSENHFHIHEKLDKDEIWRMRKEIGEAASDGIVEAFRKQGVTRSPSRF